MACSSKTASPSISHERTHRLLLPVGGDGRLAKESLPALKALPSVTQGWFSVSAPKECDPAAAVCPRGATNDRASDPPRPCVKSPA